MEALALAIKLADLATEAQEREEALDIGQEARRLVKDHPEAEVAVDDVADALEEEAAKPEGAS